MSDNDQTAPRPARSTSADEGAAQVTDKGSTKVPAGRVANAAAQSLHGGNAVPEKFAQPDAKSLVGGNTLISDPSGANPAAGERA